MEMMNNAVLCLKWAFVVNYTRLADVIFRNFHNALRIADVSHLSSLAHARIGHG